MGEPRRVLVVDDEASIRVTTVLNLTREGYSTAAASDGREALGKISEWKPHLVLLDIKLPGENGIDICRKIASARPDHAFVVMMTAVADRRAVTAAGRAGAAGYIVKPFHTELLIQKIRAVLGDVEKSSAPDDDSGERGPSRPRRRGSGLASSRDPFSRGGPRA
ncbi:response regulator transcription factor [bacterium]|nr:response regulator transcription factor [bacterium]